MNTANYGKAAPTACLHSDDSLFNDNSLLNDESSLNYWPGRRQGDDLSLSVLQISFFGSEPYPKL